MTKTNTTLDAHPRRSIRRRMAAFIAGNSGAELDADATIHDDHIVIGGVRAQIEIARAHFADVLKLDGVSVDAEVFPDDPDWTCMRIPVSSIAAAIAKAKPWW